LVESVDGSAFEAATVSVVEPGSLPALPVDVESMFDVSPDVDVDVPELVVRIAHGSVLM